MGTIHGTNQGNGFVLSHEGPRDPLVTHHRTASVLAARHEKSAARTIATTSSGARREP